MSAEITLKCECVNGMTLDKMSDLIAQRTRVLGETTKDAVIATAINVLSSLRAKTRDAKKSKVKIKITTEVDGGILPGFSNTKRRRVLRQGDRRRGEHWNPPEGKRVVWLTYGRKIPDRLLSVYHVVPQFKYDDYYAVADSPATVQKHFNTMCANRIKVFGTMAKRALGVAMNQLSTRQQNDEVHAKANDRATALTKVITSDSCTGLGEGNFGCEVTDALDYAVDALKGGSGEIESAFQAAANKTAGIMKNYMTKHGAAFFNGGETVTTPFPDIVRRR